MEATRSRLETCIKEVEDTKDRTWAEIRLDNIEHNYKSMRKRLPHGCRFMGVVKANAYGHGAVPVSGLLSDLGAEYLAVASIDEGRIIRNAGINLPILVLGYTPVSRTNELTDLNLTQTVYSSELASGFSEALKGTGKTLKCHLKLDSGMGRLGFFCNEDGLDEASLVMNLSGLVFEGVFSHFAVSDVWRDTYTNEQFIIFKKAVAELESRNGDFELTHSANSGAMINYPEMYLDMVRPGIALYGAYNESSPNLESFDLKPVMELKTRIVQIKKIAKGTSISYGRTFCAKKSIEIAVLPIGYADGLHRSLSGKIEMLLKGRRIKQVGRICMDMCMVDITDAESANPGDEVIIFGESDNETILISEHSKKIDTITYELLCSVSERVPRKYLH